VASIEEGGLEFRDESRPRLPAVGAAVATDSKGKTLEGEFNLTGGGMTPGRRLL
jgi:hypothetical protein